MVGWFMEETVYRFEIGVNGEEKLRSNWLTKVTLKVFIRMV